MVFGLDGSSDRCHSPAIWSSIYRMDRTGVGSDVRQHESTGDPSCAFSRWMTRSLFVSSVGLYSDTRDRVIETWRQL